jgi:hypothetical protein
MDFFSTRICLLILFFWFDETLRVNILSVDDEKTNKN